MEIEFGGAIGAECVDKVIVGGVAGGAEPFGLLGAIVLHSIECTVAVLCDWVLYFMMWGGLTLWLGCRRRHGVKRRAGRGVGVRYLVRRNSIKVESNLARGRE